MPPRLDSLVQRRRARLAALVLLSLIAATVHLAAVHDRAQCPCGVPHAHSGLSLRSTWCQPGPPPLAATPAPSWEVTLHPARRANPFRPLRAPPLSSIQGYPLPA